MRTLSGCFAVLVMLSVCPCLCADDKTSGDSKDDVATTEKIQDLNLTDEQEAKIAEIRKEYRSKIAEATKDLATRVNEEVAKLRDVLTPEQKDNLKEQKDDRHEWKEHGLAEQLAHLTELDLTGAEIAKIEEIRKEYRPKIEMSTKKMAGILTDEQMKTRVQAVLADKSRREIRQGLNLTEEQKSKIDEASKDLTKEVREMMEKIREVLHEEEQAKPSDPKEEREERVRDRMARKIANLAALSLTDEQKTKMSDIRQEYRPKVQDAGNRLRALLTAELEAIIGVLKQ
jgi:Spy/CpxP family protein refolding chaperone